MKKLVFALAIGLISHAVIAADAASAGSIVSLDELAESSNTKDLRSRLATIPQAFAPSFSNTKYYDILISNKISGKLPRKCIHTQSIRGGQLNYMRFVKFPDFRLVLLTYKNKRYMALGWQSQFFPTTYTDHLRLLNSELGKVDVKFIECKAPKSGPKVKRIAKYALGSNLFVITLTNSEMRSNIQVLHVKEHVENLNTSLQQAYYHASLQQHNVTCY